MFINIWIGRFTFSHDMAEGILRLLGYRKRSALPVAPTPCGTYNLIGEGSAAGLTAVALGVQSAFLALRSSRNEDAGFSSHDRRKSTWSTLCPAL